MTPEAAIKELDGFNKEIGDAIFEVTRDAGKMVQGRIKAAAPVRTGRVRRNVKKTSTRRSKGGRASSVTIYLDGDAFYGRIIDSPKFKRHVPFFIRVAEDSMDEVDRMYEQRVNRVFR